MKNKTDTPSCQHLIKRKTKMGEGAFDVQLCEFHFAIMASKSVFFSIAGMTSLDFIVARINPSLLSAPKTCTDARVTSFTARSQLWVWLGNFGILSGVAMN